MAKRESTFMNMVLTLLAVTGVSALALGFVYDLTKDAIDAAKLKAQTEAIAKVLPSYETLGQSFTVATESAGDSLVFFPAYNGNELAGVAIKTFTKNGFSGYISVMAGIDNSGNFSGYEILEHAETPGLGSKMGVWFSNAEKPGQYVIGKNPHSTQFEVTKDGGDIDAITASTISSRAFLEALVRAYKSYEQQAELSSEKK